ncbi:hypothetical protein BCG9842_B2195 [Bacillus cereus G9842]|uniref:Uncharacterized protein n=1 Tax=Bacillus cereus (strain G9842) TaxID=405531 RepID=B7ILQ8_BACC2|nr:hypothetical protein BCG9842_B2195 [Bacillus cereus G9842]
MGIDCEIYSSLLTKQLNLRYKGGMRSHTAFIYGILHRKGDGKIT